MLEHKMRERDDFLLFISSGMISFCLMALLAFGLFVGLVISPTKYASISDSAITIESIDLQAYLDINKEAQIKEERPVNNPLEGLGVNEMFENVDSDEVEQKSEKIADNREKMAQNADTKKLQELIEQSKNIQERLNAMDTIAIANSQDSNEGEFDEYYAQIQQIFQRQWDNNKTFLPPDLVGVALIHINQKGEMTYSVKRYSQDSNFDSTLDSVLRSLKDYPFPPPKKARSIDMQFKSNITKNANTSARNTPNE